MNSPSYKQILFIALPIILANALLPIQGLVDTAVAGQFADMNILSGVGLMAEFWAMTIGCLNFLQMGTSGLSSQALGSKNTIAVQKTLVRGLMLALILGAMIVVCQDGIFTLSQKFYQPQDEIRTHMQHYYDMRVWSAFAELANYVLIGWFAGQGMSKNLLIHQAVLTVINVIMTLLLTQVFTFGIEGLALGTIIGHTTALFVGLGLAEKHLRSLNQSLLNWLPETFKLSAFKSLLSFNLNFFIRTFLVFFCLNWMMMLSVKSGAIPMATMAVIMWLMKVASFALDGVALAAEGLIGQAIGARQSKRFEAIFRKSLHINIGFAVLMAVFYAIIYTEFVTFMTPISEIHTLAESVKFWIILLPLVSVTSYIIDGIFFAATAAKLLRNGMIIVALITLPCAWLLQYTFGYHGVWAGIWLFFVTRIIVFWLMLPKVRAMAFGEQN